MTNKKRLIIFTGIYFVVLLFGVIYFTRNLIEKIAITSFKKLFSTYNQALLLTVNDMDDNIGCYFSADKNYPSDFSKCDKFYKIFSTNLKVTKYCKDKSFEKGFLSDLSSK